MSAPVLRGPRRPGRRPVAPAVDRVPAAELPVARVVVDVPLAHLDRPFDYLLTEEQAAQARPGVRVRVRFSGRLVDGFVVHRQERSEHDGRLAFVERVVSAESVLSADVLQLARAVGDRYAGPLADVLRLAVPPRHAKVEAEPDRDAAEPEPALPPPDGRGWAGYPAGTAFLRAVSEGRPVRAAWQALPGEPWPARLAELAHAAVAAGRGALLLVPDATDLVSLDAALTATLGTGRHLVLSADLGPAERYRRFLAVRRGRIKVVAGTRAAAFAPVAELGVLAIFDDGYDVFAEPRSPYPHAREVLTLRSAAAGIPLLIGGFARSTETALLVGSGWAKDVTATRTVLRARMPRIESAADDHVRGAASAAARSRIAPVAFAAARDALAAGRPVLVQVPRRGHTPGLACQQCRRPARCRHCSGPLGFTARNSPPRCAWCGRPENGFVCPACGDRQLRSVTVGADRTAEELGRAFPGVPVLSSAGDHVLTTVAAAAALVIATPGAEPAVEGGYGSALLLDADSVLAKPVLKAGEEALRRWLNAAALVRPAADGGRVVVNAEAGLPAVQALIRWDPVRFAADELAARRELRLPPAVAMCAVDGPESAVLELTEQWAAGEFVAAGESEVLGPVPLDEGSPAGGPDVGSERVRALIRVPLRRRKELAAGLKTLAAGRSVRKDTRPVRIRIDPDELF